MKHYTKEELELYRHGQMSVIGKISCSSHLHECETCQELLKELESEDDFVKELRNSIQIYNAVLTESPRQTSAKTS